MSVTVQAVAYFIFRRYNIMRRLTHHMALVSLTFALAVGSVFPAFADPDENYGPAFAEQNQEEPDSSEPFIDTETPEETAAAEITPAGEDPAPAQTAPSVPAISSIQLQLLDPESMNWTPPVADGSLLQVGGSGALSLCIYSVNGMRGDAIYRTYSGATGWSNWVMNGDHSPWTAGVPIEAVQIRLSGQLADNYSVYYSSVLSDGTTCGWAANGATSGTMATGKYITGLRAVLIARAGGDASSLDTANAVSAPAAEGISFENGLPTYTSGTGQPFTGWVWNDRDRYYFADGNAVTGWQYIDGYKYYFEGDGRLVTDLEPYLNHPGPFQIRINKQMNCTTIYVQDGENGFIIPYKSFLCSTGDDTPIGTFKTPEKYRWRLMVTGEYCQYLTRLGAGLPILMHSAIYEKPNPYTLYSSTYNFLGISRSHGCIRFTAADCKWIYDHCALGTSVTVYNSPVPGPFDRPALKVIIPSEQTWDPTDDSVPENGLS